MVVVVVEGVFVCGGPLWGDGVEQQRGCGACCTAGGAWAAGCVQGLGLVRGSWGGKVQGLGSAEDGDSIPVLVRGV